MHTCESKMFLTLENTPFKTLCFLEHLLWLSCLMPPYFICSFLFHSERTKGTWVAQTWRELPTSMVFLHLNGVQEQTVRCSPSLPSSKTMSSPGSRCVLSNPTSISLSAHGGSWMGMEAVSHPCKQPGCGTIMGWGAGKPAGPLTALKGADIFGKLLWKYQGSWHREGSSAHGLNLLAGSHHVGCDHLHSGVQSNFLPIGPGTTPGEQLAHGTCASWAIQKCFQNTGSQAKSSKLSGDFLSPQNSEEAIH